LDEVDCVARSLVVHHLILSSLLAASGAIHPRPDRRGISLRLKELILTKMAQPVVSVKNLF
ncbi:MAG: hypothetical protein AB1442_15395, partial [Nitrospirota bacterium]